MEKNDLQTAVSRAEAKFGPEWHFMSPKARAAAIYEELRELDRKSVSQTGQSSPSGAAGEEMANGDLGQKPVSHLA